MNIIELRPNTIIRGQAPLWRNARVISDENLSEEMQAIADELKRRRTIH